MTGRELENSIMRTGQERNLRKLCIDSGLIPAEKVAVMALCDVCEAIARVFDLVGVCDGGDRILLVAKKDKEQLWKLLKPIDR